MGESRVIYTDATTAEAINALKAIGYLETPEGGCFLNITLSLMLHFMSKLV